MSKNTPRSDRGGVQSATAFMPRSRESPRRGAVGERARGGPPARSCERRPRPVDERADEGVVVVDAEAEADPPAAPVDDDPLRREAALDVLGVVEVEREKFAARLAVRRRERDDRQPRERS